MRIANVKSKISSLFLLVMQIAALPVAHLKFYARPHPEHIARAYRHFVKPHPRYKLFKNKSLGAALIDLRDYSSSESFVHALRGWGRAAAERRKAQKRGYVLKNIDRNHHIDEIHEINISSAERQGRPMDPAYMTKQLRYDNLEHFQYFGLFNRENQLRAYCNVCHQANFAFIDRVIGHKNPDGAMYLLITEITCGLISERKLNYLMYDTIFGAQPGLRAFKRRLGFRPYRVKYGLS